MLLQKLVCFFLAGVNAGNITITPALPENILASGYSGLRLTTLFVNRNYEECFWRFNSVQANFYNPVACGNTTSNGLLLLCIKHGMVGEEMITTSLTVPYPLQRTQSPAQFAVLCRISLTDLTTIASTSIVIQGTTLQMFILLKHRW